MFHGSRLRTLEKRLIGNDGGGYQMFYHDGKRLYDMVTWEPKYLLPDEQQTSWAEAESYAPVGHLYCAMSIHLANPEEPGIKNKAMQRKVRKWKKTHYKQLELARAPEPKSSMTASSLPIETNEPYVQHEDPPDPGPPKPAPIPVADDPLAEMQGTIVIGQRREIFAYDEDDELDLNDPIFRQIHRIKKEGGRFFAP